MTLVDLPRRDHPGAAVAAGVAARYRAWLAAGATKAGPDPLELGDAAHECPHGRLAHDAWREPDCVCWMAPADAQAKLALQARLRRARVAA